MPSIQAFLSEETRDKVSKASVNINQIKIRERLFDP